jgi:hypothetical protein
MRGRVGLLRVQPNDERELEHDRELVSAELPPSALLATG